MGTLLWVGNSEGQRRCDARCHEAEGADCDCICGGRYHGIGGRPAAELIHRDVLEGRYGGDVAACTAQLGIDALQESLFAL